MAIFQPAPLPTTVAGIGALLKKSARTANGAMVSLAGYTTAGDGGGGFSVVYRWAGRSLITVDAVRYFTGSGVDDYYERADRNTINVRQAGCVGDGTTDDTARFIAAVNAAQTLGVPLYVSSGNYLLSSWSAAVDITADFTIFGDGESSKITGPSYSASTAQLFYVRNTNGPAINCEGVSFSTWYRVWNFEWGYNSGTFPSVITKVGQPYTISLIGNYCDNFGCGILGVNPGVKYQATSIKVLNNRLTNMCKAVSSGDVRPWAIDISVVDCPSVTVSNNYLEDIGTATLMADAGADMRAIAVDFVYATVTAQSAIVTDNIINNVTANCASGQVAAIIVQECQAVIANNQIDTVTSLHASNTSSPEAIYTKAAQSIVTGNTIIDCVGKEGVINMKGEYLGADSSEGSVCANNIITFRSLPLDYTVGSTGINMDSPHITCRGNLVEGVNRGIVSIFTGSVIQGNTLRYCNSTGIESISDIVDVSLVIKDNMFTAIGNVNNANATGVYITCPDTATSYELIEITGNTFDDFVDGPYAVAVRVIAESTTEEITRLIINRNVCNQLNNFISLLGTETIRYCEINGNSIYGADAVFTQTATTIRRKRLLNMENGGFWVSNDSVVPYDPTSVSGLVSWWSARDPDDVRNSATYVAVDLDQVGEVYQLSSSGASLIGVITPLLHNAARSGLPTQAIYMRGLGDELRATLPASCGTGCTMFFVGKPGVSSQFTANAGTDVITNDSLNNYVPANNDPVEFHGRDLPAPLVAGTTYYARDVSGLTLKVSTTPGGAAIDLTDAGSGAMNYRIPDTKYTWWYQDYEAPGTAFAASAETDEVTKTAHGLTDTTAIKFTGAGLPDPLIANTTYYVRDSATNTFKVAATPGGAAIVLTDAGSGAMTYTTALDLRRLWSAEDGGAGPGLGLSCGTPTFRVNGVATSFTTTDNVFDATSEKLTVITAEGLDFSGWGKGAGDFRLGGYLKSLDAGHMAGYFCECMIFSGAVSASDRSAIEAYLMDIYEIV